MGKHAPKQFDRRRIEARRLKALELAITDADMQGAILKKNAASLALAQEQITAKQARGEDVDPDLVVRVSNALQRAVVELNDSLPAKRCWVSQADLDAEATQKEWLQSLSLDELLALRERVAPGVPLPEPAPEYVEPAPMSDVERAAYEEEARAYAATLVQSKTKIKKESVSDTDPYADWVNSGVTL